LRVTDTTVRLVRCSVTSRPPSSTSASHSIISLIPYVSYQYVASCCCGGGKTVSYFVIGIVREGTEGGIASPPRCPKNTFLRQKLPQIYLFLPRTLLLRLTAAVQGSGSGVPLRGAVQFTSVPLQDRFLAKRLWYFCDSSMCSMLICLENLIVCLSLSAFYVVPNILSELTAWS